MPAVLGGRGKACNEQTKVHVCSNYLEMINSSNCKYIFNLNMCCQWKICLVAVVALHLPENFMQASLIRRKQASMHSFPLHPVFICGSHRKSSMGRAVKHRSLWVPAYCPLMVSYSNKYCGSPEQAIPKYPTRAYWLLWNRVAWLEPMQEGHLHPPFTFVPGFCL